MTNFMIHGMIFYIKCTLSFESCSDKNNLINFQGCQNENKESSWDATRHASLLIVENSVFIALAF